MTPERLREIIAATGRDRRELARMLGYGSENSLRQAEAGKQVISKDRARWLERYAKVRARHAASEAVWLEKNPPPNEKPSLLMRDTRIYSGYQERRNR